jgi:hypothetical protein
MPKPMSSLSRRHFSVNAPIASRISTAICTAWRVGLSTGTGSLKTTITPSLAFERAAALDNDFANRRMVIAQQHITSSGSELSEKAREPALIAEERGNLSAMAFELLLAARRNDQISYLRMKEGSQPADALDFRLLGRRALFELLI